jgi:hypothetical protein
MKNINERYFEMLKSKASAKKEELPPMHCPENNIHTGIIPLPIASHEDRGLLTVMNYEDLPTPSGKTSDFILNTVKMQAGLGSSVKRSDLIKKVQGRDTLGAKGTDLYFDVLGKERSIAEIQLLQAYALAQKNSYKEVNYQSLVNEETTKAVAATWLELSSEGKSYQELFTQEEKVRRGSDLFQQKMPTIGENGELTTERMAPAGHGFLGFLEIIDIFENDQEKILTTIGNGEDLNSTPDLKIMDWVAKNDIPIVMMTTTKTLADKKGGQISLVKGEHPTYVTIVEKAQAEATNQLQYFEELGLRAGDRESLFNTNIVIINKHALKEVFNRFLKDTSTEDFIQSIAPDVILNVKEQSGKKFTQLESALGSVILNLDKYMRLNFDQAVVSFLNLNVSDRTRFFMPIKKREDYEELHDNYVVDSEDFRLHRKS